jgi:hypothetical protein
MEGHMLRHFIATLSYRTTQAIQDAPSHYPFLDIGKGVRKPIEILNHMTFLMGYTTHCFQAIDLDEFRRLKSWELEVSGFYETLEQLDQILAEGKPPINRSSEQLLQGPFSDAMTHVGQLTLLRRLADSSVSYENFMEANIQKGFIYPEKNSNKG